MRMKITGITLLMIICIFTGNYLGRRTLERVRTIELIILMIKNIRTQIQFAKLPADQLLEFLEKNSDFKKLGFISEARNKLKNGKSFQSAWSEAVNDGNWSSALKSEDKVTLTAFSSGFGSSDSDGQLNNCDTYINLFEMKADGLRQKAESSVKVCNSLGLLCGTLIAIILF